MENRTTTLNKFLVEIIDTKNGGRLGVVWQMDNKEIERFNADNAGYMTAVAIDR